MRQMVHLFIVALVLLLAPLASLAQNPPVNPNCGPPNLMLVVDTSGSMTQANKIDALKAAITEAVQLFKADLRFGLTSFSNGKATLRVQIGPDDPKDLDSHAQKVIDAAKQLVAIGDTPMTQAMQSAYNNYQKDVLPNDALHKVSDLQTMRRCFVLLMTDGEPTDGDPLPEIKKLRTTVVGSKTYDIRTYVVGMGSGTEIRPYQLDQFAKAGGTEKFFQALNKDDLAEVFKRIAGTAVNRETCNGKDDDCNGLIDEDLKRDCKSSCGVGVEVCKNGQWSQCDAPAVEAEICDGHDNNCNGQIDEGLTRPCKSPCGEGNQGCIRGDWSVCSAPQPEPEVCDGKDNDCDGQIDNGSACPGGQCVASSGKVVCDIPCRDKECPAGFRCDSASGKCAELPCRRKKCPAGQICINNGDQGECTDLCTGVTCAAGLTCGRKGTCINCYQEPCAPGMNCLEGRCVIDPCYNVTCPDGQGCRDGNCFDTCLSKKCPTGQRCQTADPNYPRGTCISDNCANTKCPYGQVCKGGQCVANKCATNAAATCTEKQICNPETGACEDDPCLRTHCPANTKCLKGECISGSAPPPTDNSACKVDGDCGSKNLVCKNGFCLDGNNNAKGGSGTGCNCALLSQQGGMLPTLMLAFLLFLLLCTHRYSRRLF